MDDDIGTDTRAPVILANGRIVDAESGKVGEPTTLEIRDGCVHTIRPLRAEDYGSNSYDLGGRYICPGLIDCHTHLTFTNTNLSSTGSDQQYGSTIEVETARDAILENLSDARSAGIAVVRDLGAGASLGPYLKELFRASPTLPLVVTAGVPLCPPGGHAIEFGREPPPPGEITAYVTRHRSEGHRWLKLMNGPRRFPLDQLGQLVSAAHAASLRVAVHVSDLQGAREAMTAGSDTIEHVLPLPKDDSQGATPYFVPTLYCSHSSLQPGYLEHQTAPYIRSLHEWAHTLSQQLATEIVDTDRIAIGTDAACSPCGFWEYHAELHTLANQSSLTDAQVLAAATVQGAKALGLYPRFGAIAAGSVASFQILDDDPSRDVSRLRETVAMFIGGACTYMRRGELWPYSLH